MAGAGISFGIRCNPRKAAAPENGLESGRNYFRIAAIPNTLVCRRTVNVAVKDCGGRSRTLRRRTLWKAKAATYN
jgi:hypothetical protein